ncbi:MAG: hypothetical protein ACXWLR_10695 [Myxococcales bacterium]
MTLDKRIAGTLVLGAGFLLCEIRFEHREVLGETWRGWIPLSYAAILLAAGVPAWLSWHKGGRKVLAALFALAIAVGLLGAWFHSDGRPDKSLLRVARAWALPPGKDGGVKPGAAPPLLAPLAFSGLGLLGLLACASNGRGGPVRE